MSSPPSTNENADKVQGLSFTGLWYHCQYCGCGYLTRNDMQTHENECLYNDNMKQADSSPNLQLLFNNLDTGACELEEADLSKLNDDSNGLEFCPLCTQVFTNELELIDHVEDVHGQENSMVFNI